MTKLAKNIKTNKHYMLFFTNIFIGILLGYFFLYPNNSGVIGKFFQPSLFYIFGKTNYLLPFLFFMMGLRYLRDESVDARFLFLGFFLTMIFGSTIIALFFQPEHSGVVGNVFAELLIMLVGKFGTYLSTIFLIILGLYLLNFDVILHIGNIVKNILGYLKKNEKPKNKIIDAEVVIAEPEKNIKPAKKDEDLAILKAFEDTPSIVNMEAKKSSKPKPVELKQKMEISNSSYKLPPTSLLEKAKTNTKNISQDELKQNAKILQKTLQDFGVEGNVNNILPGPVITRYEIELAPGVKVASIVSLQDDICLAMKTQNVRIISPIPGKSAIGIEIPNKNVQPVVFRDIVEDPYFRDSQMILPFAIGKTVSGSIACTDISKTPHLLVAGATGSGKSVCINSLIMSILYTKTPDEVKFIMVDPKVVELSYYRDIPHLYSPVITNPKEASRVLQQIVGVMEARYEKFAEEGARNIESYNEKMAEKGSPKEFYLIVIIDELADLMLVASKDVEESIARLTQKARAVGIHVVLATQRPSVNVVTGIIKANLPSRISFQVLSKIDSRVILDANGAESLIGKGDMLFLENGASKPVRLQGAFLSEKEVQQVIKFIKNQASADYSAYQETISKMREDDSDIDDKTEQDLKKALSLVLERQKISYDLMRANGFSGPKATNLISLMEIKGFIEKPVGAKQWEIYFDSIEEYLRK